MFDFSQYLGFLLFLTVLTIGFWLLFFLIAFVQYWIGGALWEMFKEWRAKKKLEAANE
jgi:Na+-transporting methylmalonyl-CoA/oxaloacetate decarboxylase gamma subunit